LKHADQGYETPDPREAGGTKVSEDYFEVGVDERGCGRPSEQEILPRFWPNTSTSQNRESQSLEEEEEEEEEQETRRSKYLFIAVCTKVTLDSYQSSDNWTFSRGRNERFQSGWGS